MRLRSRVSTWTGAIHREPGGRSNGRFARHYLLAFLAGAVGIACPPAKPVEHLHTSHHLAQADGGKR